jgi:hypothetical protein
MRPAMILVAYVACYLAASFADLASTSLGLRREGIFEKNVFVVTGEGYSDFRAWLITIFGGLVLVGCVWFAARNANRVDERWLQRPFRSLGVVYLSPWSSKGLAVAPMHALSLAMAFVVLRFVAAANNLLVYFFGVSPMGTPMKVIGARMSPLAGFVIVGFSCLVTLAVVLLPLASRTIRSWRPSDNSESRASA